MSRNDNQRLSLGVKGWAAFDLQSPIVNGPGADFVVYENDTDLEACSVYVANDWNGPWFFCGFDTGTSAYDLSRAGIGQARYVRIADDGDGVNGATGGFDLDAIEAIIVNAPALALNQQIVYDSTGNNNQRFDPGETVELVLELKNFGRLPAFSIIGILRENDPYVTIFDSLGTFGDILPDSTQQNNLDRFIVMANNNTPTEHIAQFLLHLAGTGYEDSLFFTIRIGEFSQTDPIPDGPREPALYWAYDDVDSLFLSHPDFEWIEINTVGTRLTYAHNDEVKLVNLPTEFGPWQFYGNRYTQISISADGWIAVGANTTPAYNNTNLPNTTNPNGIVALNWDDLYPNNSGSGGIYYYHDSAHHRFIIEYDSVPYYNPRTVMDKFQLIIYDTTISSATGDNSLIAQYQTANRLSSSTVGIEDPTGLVGIQCLYNETRHRGCAPFVINKAIKYTTDAPVQSISESITPIARRKFIVLPNPFRIAATVQIPDLLAGELKIGIYDITGKLVNTLHGHSRREIKNGILWDGKDSEGRKLPAGVYLIKLESTEVSYWQKVIIAR